MSVAAPRRDSERHAIGLALAAVLVAVALVSALVLGLRALGIGQHRPPIVVIGDSITANLEPTLRRTIGDDYALTVAGQPGVLVAHGLLPAQNAARFPFRQAVVNLGTNDVMTSDHHLDESIASLKEIVGSFEGLDCVHVVTVSEHMVNDTGDAAARAARFNAEIRAIGREQPNVRVVDWSREVGDYETDHPGETITTDSVHPDDTGNRVLAQAYAESLAACDA